jgi:hypothetical protein
MILTSNKAVIWMDTLREVCLDPGSRSKSFITEEENLTRALHPG